MRLNTMLKKIVIIYYGYIITNILCLFQPIKYWFALWFLPFQNLPRLGERYIYSNRGICSAIVSIYSSSVPHPYRLCVPHSSDLTMPHSSRQSEFSRPRRSDLHVHLQHHLQPRVRRFFLYTAYRQRLGLHQNALHRGILVEKYLFW